MCDVGGDARFIASGRHDLVDVLMADFEAVQQEGARPRLVTLEAPTGWGKTRVVQSFYARLAPQQGSRYWPPSIIGTAEPVLGDQNDGARKLVFPDPRQAVHDEDALPEYFWWGLTATRRQAGLLPVKALVEDLDQFELHNAALEGRFKSIASLRQRSERIVRRDAGDVGKDLASSAAGAAVDAAVAAAGATAGLPLGPAGVAAGMAVSLAIARVLRARRDLAAAPSIRGALPFGVQQENLIGPVGAALTDFARAGVPLIIVVEDVHTADEPLVDLLVGLLTGRAAPILVVATCWPGLLDEEDRPAQRLVGVVPQGAVRRNVLGVLGGLDRQELSDLARQALADHGLAISDADAERLAGHFSNPLAMKLAARTPRLQRTIDHGRLEQEIATYPRDVAGVFKLMWDELPADLRSALTLAVLSSPAGVPKAVGTRLLDSAAWDPELIAAAAAATPWLADQVERLEDCLGAQSEAYGWAQRLDEWLRTWLEPAQAGAGC
jgi:hypothetical protein